MKGRDEGDEGEMKDYHRTALTSACFDNSRFIIKASSSFFSSHFLISHLSLLQWENDGMRERR